MKHQWQAGPTILCPYPCQAIIGSCGKQGAAGVPVQRGDVLLLLQGVVALYRRRLPGGYVPYPGRAVPGPEAQEIETPAVFPASSCLGGAGLSFRKYCCKDLANALPTLLQALLAGVQTMPPPKKGSGIAEEQIRVSTLHAFYVEHIHRCGWQLCSRDGQK